MAGSHPHRRRFALLLIASVYLLAVPRAARAPLADRPPWDARVLIMAVGEWKGRFAPDAAGRSGLGALKTHADRRKRLLAAEGGAALLLHTGNLTGARNSGEFVQRLRAGLRPDLPLGFAAVALSASEHAFLAKSSAARRLMRRAKAVSFDYAVSRRLRKQGGLPEAATIARASDRLVLITALGNGNLRGKARQDSEDRLRDRVFRTSGADLKVVLLPALRPAGARPTGQRPVGGTVGYFATAVTRGSGSTSPGRSSFLRPRLPWNPHPLLKSRKPVLLVLPDRKQNEFFRAADGSYVCSIRGRTVCEVEFVFRDTVVTAVRQRFVRLNGPHHPGRRVRSDERLPFTPAP